MIIKIHGDGPVYKNHKEISSVESYNVMIVLIVQICMHQQQMIQDNLNRSETKNLVWLKNGSIKVDKWF